MSAGMSEGTERDAPTAATVDREAFVTLMREYLESEGKQPDRETLEQVCGDWLESHGYERGNLGHHW